MGALQLKLSQQNQKIPQEIALKCHFFIFGGEEMALSILGEKRPALAMNYQPRNAAFTIS